MTGKTPPADIDNIRHSLAHLLAMAVLKKFPDAKLGIGPTIENGFYYDIMLNAKGQMLNTDDLPEIEKVMRELIAQKLDFVGKKITPAETKKIFKNQPFKLDLIKDFVKEKKPLTVYSTYHSDERPDIHNSSFIIHNSCFTDLCRGGHIKNTSEINPEAFKLTKTAGAYWKGDSKKPQLTRIYGVAFETKEELEKYLCREAEAVKRDHRTLG